MSRPASAEDLLKAVREDPGSNRFFPSLAASTVVGMMTVVMSVSFVPLIFGGTITGFSNTGTSLMLLTAVIMAVSMALFSSYPGMIAIPQDRVAPIFALMATLIMEEMHNAPVEKVGITVLAAIAVNTVLVGACLFLLGAYRLGNIVRYAPYPVIGGFLAGSGWLLVVGSFRVITGEQFSIFDLPVMYESGDLAAWAPGAIFGAVAYIGVRYSHHYLTLPVIVFCSILVFYVWLGLSHHALPEARGRGWLLGTIPNAGLLHLRPLPTLFGADWLVVANQYGTLIAVALTSILSILLNTSALELATDEEIDLNQELRTAGLANLVTGMSGGMLGFQSLTLSVLPIRMEVRSRLVSLFSAAVCLLLLSFGTGLAGYIPKFVLSGILFYNGLTFLAQWVIDSYRRLIREDYILVVLILAIVALAGYLQGIGAGIIIATVLFVRKYSSVSVISNALSGEGYRSSVDRSPTEDRALERHGAQIHILRLKGFIFFGSADSLFNTIRARHADGALPRLAYVILDFQHVSGLDTSGIMSLSKLARFARRSGFTVLAASMPGDIEASLRSVGLFDEEPGPLRLFHDRDHAIEWCENEILRQEPAGARVQPRSLPDILNDFHPWTVSSSGLLAYTERLELPANHPLIVQGDAAHELFFIESGRVKVLVQLGQGRSMRVRTMGAGTIVGEIGLYLKQRRLASVITEEPSIVHRLSADALERMEKENPALASAFNEFMVRVLAERITQQNRTLRELAE